MGINTPGEDAVLAVLHRVNLARLGGLFFLNLPDWLTFAPQFG
jgi:hypothetical protein